MVASKNLRLARVTTNDEGLKFVNCSQGHLNSDDAVFCSACGERIIAPYYAPQESSPDNSATSHQISGVEGKRDSEEKKTRSSRRVLSRRNLIIAGLCLVILVVLTILGLKYMVKTQQDALWKRAIGTSYVTGTVGDDRTSLTFESLAKTECNTADYQEWNYYLGATTDWAEYNKCQSAATADFDSSVSDSREEIDAFTGQVGVPSSLGKQLDNMRGLDGTEKADYDSTKVGKLKVTFSYDGSNGLYVQFTRPSSNFWE